MKEEIEGVIMDFIITQDSNLLDQADKLLYVELWQPHGLVLDVRKELKLAAKEIVFIAKENEEVLGTFVFLIHDKFKGEVRHAAVNSQKHKKNIGRGLWQQVINYINKLGITTVEVYSRNTSLEFWRKLGFIEDSDWLDHELFTPHGIRFKKFKWTR